MSLADEIRSCAADTEALLADCLVSGAPGIPPRLLAATRHGTLGGGKRLRPYLLRATAGLFGVPPEASVQAGAAVEWLAPSRRRAGGEARPLSLARSE